MTNRTGHCLCGVVKFTARNLGDTFGMCHCSMCLRWSGAAFKGVPVDPENLELTGVENIKIYKSSNWAERANCAKCGSAIWYKVTDGPYAGNTSLAIGLLDDSDGLTLAREFFVDYKNSSDALPKDRKQMTEADVMAIFAQPSEE